MYYNFWGKNVSDQVKRKKKKLKYRHECKDDSKETSFLNRFM